MLGMKILQLFQIDLKEGISVKYQKRLRQVFCGMKQPAARAKRGWFYCIVDWDALIGGPKMVAYGLMSIADG